MALRCQAGERMLHDHLMDDNLEVLWIEAAMRAVGWAAQTSIAREQSAWATLSGVVERYEATVDDYTNDVCSPDSLAGAASMASDRLRAAILEELAPADERFQLGTVEDDDSRLGRFYRIQSDDGWWWHRRPAKGSLADYLATSG